MASCSSAPRTPLAALPPSAAWSRQRPFLQAPVPTAITDGVNQLCYVPLTSFNYYRGSRSPKSSTGAPPSLVPVRSSIPTKSRSSVEPSPAAQDRPSCPRRVRLAWICAASATLSGPPSARWAHSRSNELLLRVLQDGAEFR
ncbi:unnamed protein product [Urochloa humidicola]